MSEILQKAREYELAHNDDILPQSGRYSTCPPGWAAAISAISIYPI